MAFNVQIGEVSVYDDGDVIQLKARIAAAVQNGGDWVAVGSEHEFFVSAGVPISIETLSEASVV
ncbi:MAG TPA: hypothetical protein VHO01_04500 [Jatrophihabitans sp.]|nr:hypothetical protein [Jatrophihabitans sp.]